MSPQYDDAERMMRFKATVYWLVATAIVAWRFGWWSLAPAAGAAYSALKWWSAVRRNPNPKRIG